MANSIGDEPLIPLRDLKAPGIVVHGPDGEEMSLYDPRCDEIGIKTCCHCRKVNLLSEFWVGQSWCKPCVLDAHKESYRANPEPKRAYNRAKYAEDPELHRSRARQYRKGDKRRYKGHDLKKSFGISVDDYEHMLKAQDGMCAICGQECKSGRQLAVDHDHQCCPRVRNGKSCGKCIRGLLCANCNRALGLFDDDPDRLIAAATYILRYRDVLGVSPVNNRGNGRPSQHGCSVTAEARQPTGSGL